MATSPVSTTAGKTASPLDTIESFFGERKWETHREDSRLQTVVKGRLITYYISYDWTEETSILHMVMGFDLKVDQGWLREYEQLLTRINECLTVGHVEYRPELDATIFRHAVPLLSGKADQVAHFLLIIGVHALDSYYNFFLKAAQGATAEEVFAVRDDLLVDPDEALN